MSTSDEPKDAERTAFEAAIAVDPTNLSLRMVFADWLEERGFDDEAVLQRALGEKIPAENWLREFASACNLSYEQLMSAANFFLATGRIHFLGPATPDTPNIVFRSAAEFWQHYTKATGRKVPKKRAGHTFIRGGPLTWGNTEIPSMPPEPFDRPLCWECQDDYEPHPDDFQ